MKLDFRSEMCKTCIHTKVCAKDKNVIGDVFMPPNPLLGQTEQAWEKFKEWKEKGFPCDDYESGWIPISEKKPNTSSALSATHDSDLISRADALQGWIPCSERLPNESGDYLCTIPLDANETYTEVLTFHKGRFYEDDDEWGETYHDDVLAWMPLPKPYKGGEDE